MTPRVCSVGKKYSTSFVASSTDDEPCSWLNGTSSTPNCALKLLNKPHWYVMYGYHLCDLSGHSALATSSSLGPNKSLHPCTASSLASANANTGPLRINAIKFFMHHIRISVAIISGLLKNIYTYILLFYK